LARRALAGQRPENDAPSSRARPVIAHTIQKVTTMVLMEFSITPLDKGASVSVYVARCVDVVEQAGLDYRLNPMGTIVEGPIDRVLDVLRRCFEALATDCERVTCAAKFDYRRGDQSRFDSKLASVEQKLGRPVRK